MISTESKLQYTSVCDVDSCMTTAVIVCGGSSSRMNGVDKMFAEIGGKPIAAITIDVFEKSCEIDNIIIVTKAESIFKMQQLCETYGFKKVTDIVEGGSCRQRSVANGIDKICDENSIVLIHDGARPFVTEDCIKRVKEAALKLGACTCAVKVKDTLKQINGDRLVVSTLDRDSLVSVQTPQGFNVGLYKMAVEMQQFELEKFTDDCSVVEALGINVYTVNGDYNNIKITTAEDLLFAEFLIKRGN